MATSGDGAKRSGDPRQQAPSAAGGKKSGTGVGSQRGAETVPTGGAGTALPEKFGPYRVKKKLGGGGMGAVYLVENTALQREEALKVPHFDAGDDLAVRQRFIQEARAAAALTHPNLCPVYHVGALDGVYFLTMPYLQGMPLSDYTGQPQPPRKAVEIVAKLAQALAVAHGRGVIHRDLKPSNVMMCPGVGPVVMDFGLSRQVRQQDQRLTQSGTALGTPAYMPPEQIKGELERIGPASDVYSLGVILFELLTGQPPFEAATMAEVFAKALYLEAPLASALRPGVSPALDAVCRQALAKEPEQRYPTMKAFAAALVEHLRATPPAEGGGNLVPAQPERAAVLGAPTVPPNQARRTPGPGKILDAPTVLPGPARPTPAPAPTAARTNVAPGGTRVGNKASSIRRNPGAPGNVVQATVIAPPPPEEAPARPRRLLLGCVACAVVGLLVGGAGGVAAVIYFLSPDRVPQVAASGRGGTTPSANPAPVSSNPPKPTHSESKPTTPAPPVRTRPAVSHGPAGGQDPDTKMIETRPAAPKHEELVGPVLLSEDFRAVGAGARPKGWEGEAFAVQRAEDDRPCLEVTKPSDMYYVTLPRLALKGDFGLDCEVRLGGTAANAVNQVGHELHLELGSRTSTPLTIVVDHRGSVRIEDGPMKEADGFRRFDNLHFRLTRKGDVYSASVNDRVTVRATIPGKGTFEEVRLGLPGGTVSSLGQANADVFLARLYAIKIVALGKDVAAPGTGGPLPGLREGFGNVAVGTLPEGWTKGTMVRRTNLAVQNTGARPGLELLNPALRTGSVLLPRADLKGDFYADFEVVFPDPDGVVTVQLKGFRTTVTVQMDSQGRVCLPPQELVGPARFWARGRANVLRLERSVQNKAFLIKVNNTEVTQASPGAATVPFASVELGLGVLDKRWKSPQVTFVRVVPLEESAAKP
jgi:hypothetical protein